MSALEIKNLHVSIEDKKVLRGVGLAINTGEIHAIMGPNGTGKSILPTAIIGDPSYEVTEEGILFGGVSVLGLEADERAHLSLSLTVQYPNEIPGTTNVEFIRAAVNVKRDENNKTSIMQFLKKLDSKMELLNMPKGMAERYLNEGFSGGKKERNGILQLLMLEPTFVILDEIDSGLDIDALKVISKGANEMRGENFGALIITHYQYLLDYITPDIAHIMMEGRVVKVGGTDLTKRSETEGYTDISRELGVNYKEEA